MPNQATIRIFISSPTDVRPERLKAEWIVRRLDREFADHFRVEAVLWEREPLVATHHFQDPRNIPRPRSADIVVVILWSRIGVPLPEDQFRGAVSGRCPVAGTEWEFEDALAGARANGVPDLLFYRKTASATAALDDRKALYERLAQLDQVEEFIGRWFRSADGQSLSAASHSFTDTSTFEQQLYEHLHALLARRAGGAAPGSAIRWHEAPFRALLSYEYEHAPVFFGRTRARNELRELLTLQIGRGSAFVLVFGASGSGKSSLVKAGLLPDLALPGMIGRVGLVRRALMRPSDGPGGPFDALAAAILSPTALPELAGPELRYTPERLTALLREEAAAVAIEQGLAAAGKAAEVTKIAEARLVLVVDQLGEIFTIDGLGQEARDGFVGALNALARSGLVWVIATMRSDFFDRLEELPALAALSGSGRFLLLPPEDAEIGQIIREPAQEAGLRFERDASGDLGLDEAIRQAAAKDRGALPLLSFLLDQLWQKRSENGLLTFEAYKELGGLEGAIGRRAEEVFLAQPEAVQKEFVPVLRALVTVYGTTATSRPAPLSLFPEGSPRRALVDTFRHPEVRLLVNFDPTAERRAAEINAGGAQSAHPDAHVPASSGAQLRLAHEALLTHWPRAKDQIAVDARDLELRGRLEGEADRWRNAVRRDRHRRVAAGLMLAEARGLVARWGAELPAEIREFIAASRRAARCRRSRLSAMVAAAPVALALILLLVWAGMVWRGVRQVEAEWAKEHAFARIPPASVHPPYCFAMGSPVNDPERLSREEPVHQVCLKSFDLGRFEVTQQQWRRVMVFGDRNPSAYKGDKLPVQNVSWNDTQWFVRLMSFFGRHRYRLTSEAEWEYAARARTTTARYWGSSADEVCAYENTADQAYHDAEDPEQPVANCNDGYVYPAPVGSFKPNPWGLYDMLGNVAEWAEDCYAGNYSKAPRDGSAFTAPDCKYRVVRGGSWYDSPWYVRAANREKYRPNDVNDNIGFRLVRILSLSES
jgi:formylglycine-generating enzyme required for sulfatase activity